VRKLQIDMIGGVRVRTPAGRELRIASRKAQALLACLAVKPGSAVAREYLAGLLWEDSDPELARSSLRQALATLRRTLPDDFAGALRTDTNQYRSTRTSLPATSRSSMPGAGGLAGCL
jgi:DNA-binding SARP family transcriptional activator